MRILIVTPYFAPAWAYGGPPRVLFNLAKALRKLGQSVEIITTDVQDEQRNGLLFEDIEGIRVYRFPTVSNTLAYKAKLFFVPGLLSKAEEIIKRSDVVLFGDLRSLLNWQLFDYVIAKRIPYGIFPFGQIPHGDGWKSFIKKLFDVLWTRNFVLHAQWRFCQTNHEQQTLNQMFALHDSNSVLLPLPIEVPNQVTRNVKKLLQKLGVAPSDRFLIFVGRLHWLKGVDLLLETLFPLLLKDKHLKFVIIGRDDGVETQLRSFVPNSLRKQVIFAGALYGEDVLAFYKEAACFVFSPRFYEETSTAALEALSQGLPVVTTEEADVPYLEKYKAGYVVKNKPEVIRSAVEKVLREKGKRQQSKRATALIEEVFTSGKVAEKLLKWLQ